MDTDRNCEVKAETPVMPFYEASTLTTTERNKLLGTTKFSRTYLQKP